MSAVLSIVDRQAEPRHEAVELSDWVRGVVAELPPVMSPKTLSDATGYSVATLARWRKTWPHGDRIGPAFSTPPGTNSIRYARIDVAQWLDESRVAKAAS